MSRERTDDEVRLAIFAGRGDGLGKTQRAVVSALAEALSNPGKKIGIVTQRHEDTTNRVRALADGLGLRWDEVTVVVVGFGVTICVRDGGR